MSRLQTLRLIIAIDRLRFLYVQAAYAWEDVARIKGPSNQAQIAQTNESVAALRMSIDALDAYAESLANEILYSRPTGGSA